MIFKDVDIFLVEDSHGIKNTERVIHFTRELVKNGFVKGFIDSSACRNYGNEKLWYDLILEHQFEIVNIDWRNNKVVTKWSDDFPPPDCIDDLILALAYQGETKYNDISKFISIKDVYGFYLVNKALHKNVYWCEDEKRVRAPKENFELYKEWVFQKDKDINDSNVFLKEI